MRAARAILALCIASGAASAERIRVATFNLRDVRASDLADGEHPRLRALAAVIQTIRPDVLFLNEIATDPARPDANAARFAEAFLAVSQGEGLEPIRCSAFAAPSNTGVHSGHDLDRDGQADPGADARRYGGDCLGYGEFPGQYGMALLVREPLRIDRARVRTFREFKWQDMPGALLPTRSPETSEPWYPREALRVLPLSSKSHWDVPVALPGGAVLHALCAHPTPPVFDGPEDRNGRRNHDEIRFWGEYLSGASWIVDDAGSGEPLPRDAHAVILGDLNADPADGDSLNSPISNLLLAHPRVRRAEGVPAPESRTPIVRLDPTDTSRFRLRVDYVLPTSSIPVLACAVWRSPADNPPGVVSAPALPAEFPSDHFPVWADLDVPDLAPAVR